MRSLLLLVSDDVRTNCDEEIFVLLLVATAKQPYWKRWSTKERVWFSVLLSVLDRNIPHRGVLEWLEL